MPKNNHGYCTLKIEPGLHKWKNCTTKRDKIHTTQRRHHRPAKYKFKLYVPAQIVCLCSWRHFYACTDRRTVCATVHHSFIPAAQFYIYVALFTYLPVYAQQQEVQKKCNIHRPTPFIHRFIFNKLFRFADALLFVLVFNNQI